MLSHSHGPLSQRLEEQLRGGGGGGGDSWCGSAGGVKVQRSNLGTLACKGDPFERKQGGKSGAVARTGK